MSKHTRPPGYEEKFEGFLRMLDHCKRDGTPSVLIPNAETLGDTYEEVIESLSLLAKADLGLRIIGE
jgi:hypothetical protein